MSKLLLPIDCPSSAKSSKRDAPPGPFFNPFFKLAPIVAAKPVTLVK